MSTPAHPLVVMGVSGVGKSTIGALLAARTGRPFIDADDLHPPANIAKMSAGGPLSDDDRWPWLDLVGAALASEPAPVIACSALKRSYRDALRAHAPDARFVLLQASDSRLQHQTTSRSGHFMPPALLASQLAALEPLESDEAGIVIDVDAEPAELVARILAQD